MAAGTKPKIKKFILAGLLIVLVACGVVWYIFTEKFADTSNEKATYTLNALDLIKEFKKNDSLANKKYAEQIIAVSGIVTEVENADTSVNIKLRDTATGSYVIFAFQQQHLNEAKGLKKGDSVTIKGSCSGGAYSDILETEYITFKRCALSK